MTSFFPELKNIKTEIETRIENDPVLRNLELPNPIDIGGGIHHPLRASLHTCAVLLKCAGPDLRCFWNVDQDYNLDLSLADRTVDRVGICGGMPWVHASDLRLHNCNEWTGEGVTFREIPVFCRDNVAEKIKYCLVTMNNGQNLCRWIVARATDVFRLFRHFRVQSRRFSDLRPSLELPPILDPVLLNTAMENTVHFLETAGTLRKYNARMTRGLVFSGLPGNGKTMLCKWIVRQCRAKGYGTHTVTSGDLEKAYTNGQLADLMCETNVIFFDDVDISFLTRRRNKNDHGTDNRMACAMLGAMDGVGVHEPGMAIVRIFTTNEHVSDIDSAFLRPGRIDRVLAFHNPSAVLRERLIRENWNAEIVTAIETDIPLLLEKSEGMSFAELEEIKNLLVQRFLSPDPNLAGKWDVRGCISEFRGRLETDPTANQTGQSGFGENDESKDPPMDISDGMLVLP